MPFRSEQQARFMHAVHPKIAARWDKLTDFSKLPKRVGRPTRREAGHEKLLKHLHKIIRKSS